MSIARTPGLTAVRFPHRFTTGGERAVPNCADRLSNTAQSVHGMTSRPGETLGFGRFNDKHRSLAPAPGRPNPTSPYSNPHSLSLLHPRQSLPRGFLP